ncbi:MAG: ribosome maturation factor RimM [Bacteroidetes bacterium]|nr:ribosome maturation factor RimM [Bacteroidota bacterium]
MTPVHRYDKNDCLCVGRILKTTGYQGEMIFLLHVDDIEKFINIEYVFIDMDDELVPFYIHEMTLRDGHTAIVKLDDIDSLEQARNLQNRELYLPSKTLSPLKNEGYIITDVVGYSISDKRLGDIGIIHSLIHLPEQTLFSIVYKKKEILIPAVEEIIVEIDHAKKHVTVDAPEGLIEIYLKK